MKLDNKTFIPDDEIILTFARSSGAGGQNVNKVNSKVMLSWKLKTNPSLTDEILDRFLEHYKNRISKDGILIITSEKTRDQAKNIADCKEKLKRLFLKVLNPPKPRKPTKPTGASRQKRLQKKKMRSDIKKGREKISTGRSDD